MQVNIIIMLANIIFKLIVIIIGIIVVLEVLHLQQLNCYLKATTTLYQVLIMKLQFNPRRTLLIYQIILLGPYYGTKIFLLT